MIQVKLPRKKTKFQRVLEAVEDSLDGGGSMGRGLSTITSRKDLEAMVPHGARTAGLIAGGIVGLTAGSAGISSYRRRRQGLSDAS